MQDSTNVWYVYMVRCRDESLYTGISNDVPARVDRHNDGRGAKYTRSRRPVRLVYQEPSSSRGTAQRREAEIKRWSKQLKEGLVLAGDCGTR